ncbi:P1 family peptidase [Flavisolibacter tropicus]|uniref:D-aminopeptidase n=1 Tax=Flavisolibacter tropicus TaxID=1492898 RepID=A0A172U2D0_9BACT|nr:P1 family peptidase [Flavisolibacter tropicus]ANE53531.1 D-aminopeptidase [Flavisolibacter tropicus]
MLTRLFCTLSFFVITSNTIAQQRARDAGIRIGVLPTGTTNTITDVPGVLVGHNTLIQGDSVRTGVTAILPHGGNLFQQKVPASIFVGNGFGKLAGVTQVQELGNIESPILLTNTLNVATAMEAGVDYTLQQAGNEKVQSVNIIVGETNDGYLNDIRGRHVKKEHVRQAITSAKSGPVAEGAVGAGTGTVCFGWKGGIGTASRKLPAKLGGYTVGVLVQSNFGGVLQVDGVPIGEALGKYYLSDVLNNPVDGSCMIVVATNAPLDSRNLERLAKRAFMGLAKTGGIASNGSGDYVIAFSADTSVRVPHQSTNAKQTVSLLNNDDMSPLFMAAIEATEEAIINSLFMAVTTTGKEGHKVDALPREEVLRILRSYKRIK